MNRLLNSTVMPAAKAASSLRFAAALHMSVTAAPKSCLPGYFAEVS
jgi:hypothetical protein